MFMQTGQKVLSKICKKQTEYINYTMLCLVTLERLLMADIKIKIKLDNRQKQKNW